MTKKLIYYSGWAAVVAASLYFIYTSALPYLSLDRRIFDLDGFWPYAPWVVVHIVTGMAALLLGPIQFMPYIRKEYPRAHRTAGKIYLYSVLIAACVSFYLSIDKMIINENYFTNGTGLATLAMFWILTSGMAYWAARSRSFDQHREWMIRSFILTCAFTALRLEGKFLNEYVHLQGQFVYDILGWGGWSVPLFTAEFFIQGSKIRKPSTRHSNVTAPKSAASKNELFAEHAVIVSTETRNAKL